MGSDNNIVYRDDENKIIIYDRPQGWLFAVDDGHGVLGRSIPKTSLTLDEIIEERLNIQYDIFALHM